MKPTKKQLADPKWWDDNAPSSAHYCYWLGGDDVPWFLPNKLPSPHNSECLLLAKRPEPEWVPEVGDVFEYKGACGWVKCKVDYVCEQYIVVLMYDSNEYEALVRDYYELRPIKTQREEFVERAIDVMNSSIDDSQQGWAEALFDSGLFDLMEKDGCIE